MAYKNLSYMEIKENYKMYPTNRFEILSNQDESLKMKKTVAEILKEQTKNIKKNPIKESLEEKGK